MESLLVVLLLLRSTPADAGTAPAQVHTYESKDFTFALEVARKPSFDGASLLCEPVSVTIRRKADGQELQKLPLKDIQHDCAVEPKSLLVVEDMNFDGHADFRVLNLLDARLQSTFDSWVYDAKRGRFEKDARFDGLTSPTFDAKSRTITSSLRVGPVNHTRQEFRLLKDGKLDLVFEEEKAYHFQDESISLTTRRKVRGKWVETTKKVED
jgi:hypothetical protein